MYSVVISNETLFLILVASPWNGFTIRHKNILNCPKSKNRFPFALYSYCHSRDIFKELSKLSQHATFEDLRITCGCLSFRCCRYTSSTEKNVLWLLHNIFSCKSTNYPRARYKYSFLRYWIFFKIYGVKRLLAEFLKVWRLN